MPCHLFQSSQFAQTSKEKPLDDWTTLFLLPAEGPSQDMPDRRGTANSKASSFHFYKKPLSQSATGERENSMNPTTTTEKSHLIEVPGGG